MTVPDEQDGRATGGPRRSRRAAEGPVDAVAGSPARGPRLRARHRVVPDGPGATVPEERAATPELLAVDPSVLTRQTALATRAAVLASRVRPLQQPGSAKPPPNQFAHDPTSPHNLSFVTPLALVRVPGGWRSALPAPSTSQVLIVLPRQAPPSIEPVQACNAFGLESLDASAARLGRPLRLRYLRDSVLGGRRRPF